MHRATDEDLPLPAARPSRSGRSRTLVLALCALLALPGCRAALSGGAAIGNAPTQSAVRAGGLAPVGQLTGLGSAGPAILLFAPLGLPLWIIETFVETFVVPPLVIICDVFAYVVPGSPACTPPRRVAPPAVAAPMTPPAAEPAPDALSSACAHDWPVAGLDAVPARPCTACEDTASSEAEGDRSPTQLRWESGARQGAPAEPR